MNIICDKVKVVGFMLFCLLAFSFTNASGIEMPEEQSIGIDFSELAKNVELHRGETYKDYFSIKNVTDSPVTFNTEIMPFTTIDNNGGVSFKVSTSETEITNWTQLFWDKEITLNPGEDAFIRYVIDVPEDAKLGDQKEAIMLNALTPNKYGIINSNGYLIYATVTDAPSSFPTAAVACVILVILIVVFITIILLKKRKKNKSKENSHK